MNNISLKLGTSLGEKTRKYLQELYRTSSGKERLDKDKFLKGIEIGLTNNIQVNSKELNARELAQKLAAMPLSDPRFGHIGNILIENLQGFTKSLFEKPFVANQTITDVAA